MVLNGALAGLVSITAEPLTPTLGAATLIGGIGGVIVVFAVPLLDKFKIDDVVGAIPAHLVCGIWGTLIVAASYGNHVMPVEIEGELQTSYFGQLVGVLLTGVFVSVASVIVWMALKVTIGIRATEEEEMAGMDVSEVGIEAYPDFTNA